MSRERESASGELYAMSNSFNLGDGRIGGLQFQPQHHLQRLFYRMNGDGLQRGGPISSFSSPPAGGGMKRQGLYGTNFNLYEDNSLCCLEEEEGGGMRHADKKRRLSVEQVKSLEMSFEMESKLEPERKMQLATELGLQPRQVAVWFQNRRARWKTKQLERDYDHLKQLYNAVFSEKEKLRAEVVRLTQELQEVDRKRGPEKEGKKDKEGGDHEHEHEQDQPTITSSHGDCSQGAATLVRSTEDELEAEAGETEPARKNKGAEEIEQSMSPASFCSDADSNRRHELLLPSPSCTDIGISQAMKNEETKEKLQNMNLLYSQEPLACDLYFDECPITAEERQWLSYYSHAKP